MDSEQGTDFKGTILVVDDTRENLRLLVGILEAHGYQVRPATNGAWALSTAQADPPDLMLLDVMMPGLDGYTVCEALKADERTRDIPVIFISALHEVFDKVKAFAAGGVDYITKPFQVEEVLARVATHLNLRAILRELQEKNVLLQQLNERLLYELNIARDVQQSLLPPGQPAWAPLDVHCYSLPAHEVGGDLYVYHAFRRATDSEDGARRYVLAVGDVSGKGMPAALLMSATMASFRSTVHRRLTPGAFLAEMDRAIGEHTRTTQQNCALVYLEITLPPQPALPEAERTAARVCAANAGGISPIIKRREGHIEWVDIGGVPLGTGLSVTDGYQYQEACFDLQANDMLILTSDGLIEARAVNANMFGFDRLEHGIMAGPQTSAAAMLQHLRAEVERFMGEAVLHDDITIVVVQV